MLSYRHLAIVVLVPVGFRCRDDRCCLRDLAGNLAIWARVNAEISVTGEATLAECDFLDLVFGMAIHLGHLKHVG